MGCQSVKHAPPPRCTAVGPPWGFHPLHIKVPLLMFVRTSTVAGRLSFVPQLNGRTMYWFQSICRTKLKPYFIPPSASPPAAFRSRACKETFLPKPSPPTWNLVCESAPRDTCSVNLRRPHPSHPPPACPSLLWGIYVSQRYHRERKVLGHVGGRAELQKQGR